MMSNARLEALRLASSFYPKDPRAAVEAARLFVEFLENDEPEANAPPSEPSPEAVPADEPITTAVASFDAPSEEDMARKVRDARERADAEYIAGLHAKYPDIDSMRAVLAKLETQVKVPTNGVRGNA